MPSREGCYQDSGGAVECGLHTYEGMDGLYPVLSHHASIAVTVRRTWPNHSY